MSGERRRVLIIGGAGLIGSHVRRAFDREEVIATYHRTPVPSGVHLDVTHGGAIRELVRQLQPDVVVLAAAEAYVERCEREPEPTRRVNVEAAEAVAAAARDASATLVVFSSEYVFDGAAGPYGEEDLVAPINEYGRQKVALEAIARMCPDHLVCRTSGVFGWEPAGKNFVCQLIARLRAGLPLDVPPDQLITPTYAPDLADAVVALVRRGFRGTYHVVGPAITPRGDFARLVAARFDLPAALIHEKPTRELGLVAPRPQRAGLRDDRLLAHLGRQLRAPELALADMRRTEAPAAGWPATPGD